MNDRGNFHERLSRLEEAMNKIEEDRIRADERERIERLRAQARMNRWRRAWEFFKVVLSPIIAAVATALVMQHVQK